MHANQEQREVIKTEHLTLTTLDARDLCLYLDQPNKPLISVKTTLSPEMLADGLRRAINMKIDKLGDAKEAAKLRYILVDRGTC